MEFTNRHQIVNSGGLNSEILNTQISGGLRQHFADRVQRAIICTEMTGLNSAILFLGLDNFKQFNDVHGHYAGDNFLNLLAEELCRKLGDDCLIGRLGGDEFAFFLPSLSGKKDVAIQQAIEICETIRCAVNDKSVFDNTGFEPTASVGVNVYDPAKLEVIPALAGSETAMYASKQNGKNQIQLFEESLLVEIKQRATLVSDLRNAIEDAELQLKYQPQVDRNGRIIGAEALVRWKHETEGYISPGIFIPIAEETSLIDPLTDWVMEQALDTLVRWQRHPQLRNLSLSVNVSTSNPSRTISGKS